MADSYTATLYPVDLLRQILNFLEAKPPEHTVTLPAQTTVKAALRAVEDAFTDRDEPILLMHGPSNTHHPTDATSEDLFVLPIRSYTGEPSRPSISELRHQRLRGLAKKMTGAESEWREEYVPEAGREGAS
ncbi:uncharacterized protein BDW70DRAFT_155799 [Aspergillus foveolatus]|uniref:uncharacterized protein n=1 Tax=Aspergillus foveolatus TaxID=210207 RepID=UPI003CCD80EA